MPYTNLPAFTPGRRQPSDDLNGPLTVQSLASAIRFASQLWRRLQPTAEVLRPRDPERIQPPRRLSKRHRANRPTYLAVGVADRQLAVPATTVPNNTSTAV